MKPLLLIFAAASLLFSQAPDVIQTGTFTAVANGTPIFVGAGGPNGSVVWRLTYFVDGTSITAAQLAIQGADAPNAAGCATASYSTITAGGDIVVESTNPSASGKQGNVAVKAYYPCIRARSTGITGSSGTITYQLAGWKYFFNLPIVPSGTQDVNLTEVAGVAVAASAGALIPHGVSSAQADGLSNTEPAPAVNISGSAVQTTNRTLPFAFNGATWDRGFICSSQAAFNLSGSGNTEIVPLSASTVVRICHVSFTTVTPEDIKFTQGTGTNCGTGTADVSGLYKQVTGLALDFSPTGALRSSASNAICINQSVAQALGGIVVYARF